jgi:uncharacterized membrane protein
MLAVVLAVAGAFSNAVASLLERQANRDEPDTVAFRFQLMLRLLRKPVWLCAIAAIICSFLLQAAALRSGQLALVEPILMIELPIAMVLSWVVFGNRLAAKDWVAVAALSAGTALFLVAAQPSGGSGGGIGVRRWVIGVVPALVVVGGFTRAGWRASGSRRAAYLGIAAGAGFGLTAAFMKGMDHALGMSPAAVFETWPTYVMVATGIGSLFLAQNAMQAGRLVSAQPGLTLADPMLATLCGAAIFGETIRTGPWFVPEVAGLAIVAVAIVVLARSPAAREVLDADQQAAGGDRRRADGDRRRADGDRRRADGVAT